ncbi:hypothetical protein AcetOrient_orf02879 [Acetobacter orientalis]|uniref:Uncharacterized protein n=1 Tax=Acetobacter orientalis TaxID=146474 RepID=A0A2Z5ZHP5_9PROT|nr:hypothetical protein AcetOrient_orf02879 [Acetobacter orientalis]
MNLGIIAIEEKNSEGVVLSTLYYVADFDFTPPKKIAGPAMSLAVINGLLEEFKKYFKELENEERKQELLRLEKECLEYYISELTKKKNLLDIELNKITNNLNQEPHR